MVDRRRRASGASDVHQGNINNTRVCGASRHTRSRSRKSATAKIFRPVCRFPLSRLYPSRRDARVGHTLLRAALRARSRDPRTAASMFTHAASASAGPHASPAPVPRGRRVSIDACASAIRAPSLGYGRALGGASARSLRVGGRPARVQARRACAPVRAKTLEERIASGEFTQKPKNPLLWGLDAVRGAVKSASPDSASSREPNPSRRRPTRVASSCGRKPAPAARASRSRIASEPRRTRATRRSTSVLDRVASLDKASLSEDADLRGSQLCAASRVARALGVAPPHARNLS